MYQGHLEKVLKTIFPNDNLLLNTRKLSGISTATPTHTYLELDVWIPTLQLGFEFQDAHHYVTTWYSHHDKKTTKTSDQVKLNNIRKKGRTLFVVPCWWDGTVESLLASIYFQRPDVIEQEVLSSPIPLNVPVGFFRESAIPGIGEPMQPSFPVAANIIINDSSWWMGEKYDGIRCCWHPEHNVAYTRTCTELSLIPEVRESIPHFYLDAEFWFGRGLYAHTYMLFKGSVDLVSWHFMRFVAFDTPEYTYSSMPFEQRYALLIKNVHAKHPFVAIAFRMGCENEAHAQWFVKGNLDEAGEGVILRKVGSLYERGRSNSLLKLKTSQEDTEGVVLSKDQKGIQIKLPNDSIFTVPSQNVHVSAQIGDIVSFSFDAHSRKDAPANAVVYRIRTDLDWDDVVTNFQKERHLGSQSKMQNFTEKAKGHWTSHTMRTYLINFAKQRNMDPLSPQTWYKLSYDHLQKHRGGRAILKKYKGYFLGVRALFPDVKFSANMVKHAWQSERNRRRFFEDFAKENGFDPLIADNWYDRKRRGQLREVKGLYGIIDYHEKSVTKALRDLFPEIKWEENKGIKGNWAEAKVRQKFFIEYAKEKGFDPLVAENWYNDVIPFTSPIAPILRRHKTIGKALQDLFPNIGLDPLQVPQAQRYYTKENRRKFFENFAKANEFDPLRPEEWQRISRSELLHMKGAERVIYYHNNNLEKALVELFPDVKFPDPLWLTWHDKNNRRRLYFEKYAKKHGIDPLNPDDWYKQTIPKMLMHKGMSRVISVYGHNLSTALLQLFPEIGLQKHKMWRGIYTSLFRSFRVLPFSPFFSFLSLVLHSY